MQNFKFSLLGLVSVWSLILISGVYVWTNVKNNLVTQCGVNTIGTCTATDPCDSDVHDNVRNMAIGVTISAGAFFIYLLAAMQYFRGTKSRAPGSGAFARWTPIILGFLILVFSVFMLIFTLNDVHDFDTTSPVDPDLRICSSRDYTLFKWIGWWAVGFSVVFFYFTWFINSILAFNLNPASTVHVDSSGNAYSRVPAAGYGQANGVDIYNHRGHTHAAAYSGYDNVPDYKEDLSGNVYVPAKYADPAFMEKGGSVIARGEGNSMFRLESQRAPANARGIIPPTWEM